MKSNVRFAPIALVALLGLGLVGCGKQEQEAAPAATEQVALSVPADPNDERAWKLYLTGVVKQNLPEKLRTSPFMYYLPAATREDFQGEYERQLDNVYGTVSRGVLPGNMLAFGSPESAKMADLIVEAFKEASAGSFNEVRVLFIGKAEDSERVAQALQSSGAEYVFVEAK
ncbi:MAG: hypothetical protein ACK5PG_07585 [Lysobacterales bacterium]|jgi:hypothetical protein